MSLSPHDSLVKYTFRDLKRAESLLRFQLPKDISEATDWSSLRLEPASFIKDSLRKLHSDILFSARLAGNKVFFFLLLEHQSSPEYWMAYRLIQYILSIWEHHRQNNKKEKQLPAVIPIVLYHGDKPWDAPGDLFELIKIPHESVSTHQPRLNYIVDDISNLTNDELSARSLELFTHIVLQALAKTRNSENALQEILSWTPLLQQLIEAPSGLDCLRALFGYLVEVAKLKAKDLDIIVEPLGKQAMEVIMTAAEELREQGRKQGITLGRKEGITLGRKEGQTRLILRQLQRKFGEIPDNIKNMVLEADEENYILWSDRLVTAKTLDEIFFDTNDNE